MSNKYYLSKLILLNFRCQKISFLCKHHFFIDEKQTQWNLDAKVRAFHKSISCFMKCPWNCNSWNALKEKFHSVIHYVRFFDFFFKISKENEDFLKLFGFYGAPRKSAEYTSHVTISNFFYLNLLNPFHATGLFR